MILAIPTTMQILERSIPLDGLQTTGNLTVLVVSRLASQLFIKAYTLYSWMSTCTIHIPTKTEFSYLVSIYLTIVTAASISF